MSTHRGTCERCGAEGRLIGPFLDADNVKQWAAICGPCKVRVTMTPARIAAIHAAVKEVADANGVDVQVTFYPEEKES